MRKSASITLTKKLAIAVLMAALLLIPLTYLMMSVAVQPSFKQLEQVAVAQQMPSRISGRKSLEQPAITPFGMLMISTKGV